MYISTNYKVINTMRNVSILHIFNIFPFPLFPDFPPLRFSALHSPNPRMEGGGGSKSRGEEIDQENLLLNMLHIKSHNII